MPFAQRGTLIVVFLLACCAGLNAADKKPAPKPVASATPSVPVPKEILIMSVRLGKQWEILRMLPDGSCPQFLNQSQGFSPIAPTKNQGDDFAPVSSADGKQIAFYSSRSGAVNLWICNSDGSQQRQITDHDSSIISPSAPLDTPIQFSPDSKKLLFLCQGNLWVCNLATRELSTLEGKGGIQTFDISEDGKFVDYYRQGSIFEMSIGGQPDDLLIANGANWPTLAAAKEGVTYFYKGIWDYNLKQRTSTFMVSSPITPNKISKSKDMTAYVGLSPDQRSEIYILTGKKDTSGKHFETLMLTQGGGSNPFFSGDAKTVYFQREESLFSIGVDGTDVRELEILPCLLPRKIMLSFTTPPECAKP